jgi:hypothetical protein
MYYAIIFEGEHVFYLTDVECRYSGFPGFSAVKQGLVRMMDILDLGLNHAFL